MEQVVAKHCPQCEGHWIPATDYQAWQAEHPQTTQDADILDKLVELSAEPAPLDAKAAFCPECGTYLARAKVSLKTPLYLERCLSCGGFWCDRGEWEILEQVGLHRSLERLFSSGWQALAREREQIAHERQAVFDKLGKDLATRFFALAKELEQHPHGEFAAAYLMRQFDPE
jgi:Zn-finger nucleic acid-binding protein